MKKNRKLLSLFLTLAMACGTLPGLGTAVYADSGAAGDGTTITAPLDFRNSVPDILAETTSGSGIYVNNDAGITWYAAATTVEGVAYAANTLVLDGADIDCSDNAAVTDRSAYAIALPDGAKVITVSDSTVTAGDTSSKELASYGICSVGDLTFEGPGELFATGGSGAASYGIYAKSALTNSGSIIGEGDEADYSSCGIFAMTKIENTDGARMEGNSGRSMNHYATIGICCEGIWDDQLRSGGILTNAGTMIGTAADVSAADSNGIFAADSITNSGTLTGIADEAEKSSFGINSKTINNSGSMTGIGDEAEDDSSGIYSDIIVNSGSITGIGDEAENNSYGIYTGIIDNSGSMTGTGDEAEKSSFGINSETIKNSGSMTGIGDEAEYKTYGIYSDTIDNLGSLTGRSESAVKASHGIFAKGITNRTGAEIYASAGEGKEYTNGLNILGDLIIEEGSKVSAIGGNGSSECYGIWTEGDVTVDGTLNLYGGKPNGEGDKLAMLLEPADSTTELTIGTNGKITSDGEIKTANTSGFGSGAADAVVTHGTSTVLTASDTSVKPDGTGRMVISKAPVFDDLLGSEALTFTSYTKGERYSFNGYSYTFRGWFNGETELTSAESAVSGTVYTAKWENAAGSLVITDPLDFTLSDVPNVLAETTSGSGIYTNEAAGITWDASTKTLTLNNATVDCSGNVTATGDEAFGIRLPDGSRVKTTAESTVAAGDSTKAISGGIIFVGDVTFEGTALLTAVGGRGYSSCGINGDTYKNKEGKYTYCTLINKGILSCMGGEYDGMYGSAFGVHVLGCLSNSGSMTAAGDEYGIYSLKDLTNNGTMTGTGRYSYYYDSSGILCFMGTIRNYGTMTGIGGTAGDCSYGIYDTYGIENYGTMTGTAGMADVESCGITSFRSTITNSGIMTGTGGTAPGGYCSDGVYAEGTITNRTGAEIHATAGESAEYANGLNTLGGLIIEAGSTVSAIGGNGSSECYGVWTRGDVTVDGTLELYGGKLHGKGDKLAMMLEPEEDEDEEEEETATLTIGTNGKITSDGVISTTSTPFGDRTDHCYAVKNGDPALLYGAASTVSPTSAERMEITLKTSFTVNIKDTDGITPASGAKVELWKGSIRIADTQADSSGSYTFKGLYYGTYNIVVRYDGRTVTKLFDNDTDITMPAYSSVLDVEQTAGTADSAVVVDGLDQVSTSAAVTMTVKTENASTADAAQKDAISTVINNDSNDTTNSVDYIDISLTAGSSAITETSNVLTFYVTYDTTRSNIRAYRYHEGIAAALTSVENAIASPGASDDGKYFVDKVNGQIVIYASRFSTYAIGYTAATTPSSGGGSGGATRHSVTVGTATGGTVTVDRTSAYSGSTVTVNVDPDEGHALDSITVKNAAGKEIELTKTGDLTYTFRMPSTAVTVEPVFKTADGGATPDNGTASAASEFIDVASDAWYADAVAWAVANGITTGTDSTHFSPDAVTTRAQLVTFLWRASGSPTVDGAGVSGNGSASDASAFTDLESGSWYEQAVKWAAAMGYVNGIDATHFGPDENVTRAQTVTILARMAGASDTAAGSAQSFSDVSADSYYANAVAWAVENGITSGIGEGMFAPDESCTRAQIVTFLYRALAK